MAPIAPKAPYVRRATAAGEAGCQFGSSVGNPAARGVHLDRYLNLSRNSGVTNYELGSGSIAVEFKDGSAYLYTDSSAGEEHIRRLQALAIAGRGLNSYISRFVKRRYASKLR